MLGIAGDSLLASVVRLNMAIMGAIFGLFAGGLLWLATAILLWRGGAEVGMHLSLLAMFLPGYEVSWIGAWIGFFWGALYGGICGALLYAGYAATLRQGLAEGIAEGPGAAASYRLPVFVVSSTALGLGLGALAALQLVLSTNWLVLRTGGAHSSPTAALLSNYLPGYTVSFVGSLLGGVQLFAFTFVAAAVFGATYNFVAKARLR